MSAAVLWIGLPLGVAVILWLVQSRRAFTLVTAAVISLLLALLAWVAAD